MDPNPLELIKVYKANKKKPRIVRRHKYEKLGQNNQIWWNNKFKELEAKIRVASSVTDYYIIFLIIHTFSHIIKSIVN